MARPTHGYEIDGQPVPGVTTIAARASDSAGLRNWFIAQGGKHAAAKRQMELRAAMLAQGVAQSVVDDIAPVVDPAPLHPDAIMRAGADAGTCMHEMAESWLATRHTKHPLGQHTVTYADGQALLDGITAYNAWKQWHDAVGHAWEVWYREQSMVSRVHMYGGTCDAIMRDESGRMVLCDWKSSNHVYPSVLIQCAGYMTLIRETLGIVIDDVVIVQATKAGAMKWWRVPRERMAPAWDAFDAARKLLLAERGIADAFHGGKQS